MGLISRVSSRTYRKYEERLPKVHKVPKLFYKKQETSSNSIETSYCKSAEITTTTKTSTIKKEPVFMYICESKKQSQKQPTVSELTCNLSVKDHEDCYFSPTCPPHISFNASNHGV